MSDVPSLTIKAPFFRRLSTVVAMSVSLLLMPVAMVVLLSGQVYRKRHDNWHPISDGARYTYGGLLAVWLAAAMVRAALQPGIQDEWQRIAGATLTSGTVDKAADDSGLPACDSPEVIKTASEAIDESPDGVTNGIRVRDLGKAREVLFEPERKVRRCAAEALLNNGPSPMTYQLFYGPSGNLMVYTQIGEAAEDQAEKDRLALGEAQRSNRAKPENTVAQSSPAKTAINSQVMSSSDMADYCHDALGKDGENRIKMEEGLANRPARLGMMALSYSQESNNINAESRNQFGADEETTLAVIDSTGASVPQSLKKGSRIIIEGIIEDGTLWANAFDGCLIRIKATKITLDGF